MVQGLGKLLFLGEQGFFHLGLQLHQLGKGITHLRGQGRHQFVEKGPGSAQLVTVAYRPANNTAQHVAPALVTRQHPVRNEERTGTNMVGNHSQGVVVQVIYMQYPPRLLDNRPEQVDIVITVYVLHHRGHALQSHAGVHRGLGQRIQCAVLVAVVLHKHQVPDLNITIQVVILATRGAAGHIRPVIVKQLGTGAAGAGIAHLPEIFFIQTRQAIGAHPNLVDPDIRGLIV